MKNMKNKKLVDKLELEIYIQDSMHLLGFDRMTAEWFVRNYITGAVILHAMNESLSEKFGLEKKGRKLKK